VTRKIDFYGDIQGELGVIMAFSKIHDELGFSRLIPSSSRGFDIDSIDYNGRDVTVEFEYRSSSFLAHGHQAKMDESREYVVIYWEDDCGLTTKLREEYGKTLYDVISIRKYVNIKNGITARPTKDLDEPLYAVMSYNTDVAGGKDFAAWAFSCCYRVTTWEKTPVFAGDRLPPGSKVLFYQNGFIIGGFTVVRYEIIECPRTEKEWQLYKKLTDYPASLFTFSIKEYKEYEWLRGHIFYTGFFDIRDFKIRLSHYIKKKMSYHGKINLTREEYSSIIGQ